MFECLKRSCFVNDLAVSQAPYITKNMLGIYIIIIIDKTLDGFFNISKFCLFYQAVISRQNMILTWNKKLV